MNLISLAANETIAWYYEKYHQCKPWRVSVIHTFWAKLNWNCHIHFLITAWWITDDSKWKNITMSFIPYNLLKSARRAILVKHIREFSKIHFTPVQQQEFNYMLNTLFSKSRTVMCYKKITQQISQIKYIGRYLKRPVIWESRILEYDWDLVRYDYLDKKDKQQKEITVTWIEFIRLLSIHISDKHFKNIRYGWIFANRCKKKFLMILRIIAPWSKKIFITKLTYRERCMKTFWYDPLLCSCWCEYRFEKMIFDSG